ncbi:MAG: TadE/TadG family type IV pilus assembly protein [Pseudomonadota bacterium]
MVLRKLTRSIFKNTRGNAAVIFALCILPLVAILGSVVDLNRQLDYQKKLKNTVEVATISTARFALSNDASDEDLERAAQAFFDEALESNSPLDMEHIKVERDGHVLNMRVSGEMPTLIMRVAGKTALPVESHAKAEFGHPVSAEIALVLDTSYSMRGARLKAVQSAAEDMIDSLVTAERDALKMSIVPFATYVNVGTDKRDEPWLSIEPELTTTVRHCSIPDSWYETHCVRERFACSRDGENRTCLRWNCLPGDLKRAPETCETSTRSETWQGCVRSRKSPYNIRDSHYATHPIMGHASDESHTCPTPIQALTNDRAELKATVSALKADQDTYLATGLIWGLRTLSKSEPFSEAQPYADPLSRHGRKALVLMSDGANTRSPAADGAHSAENRKKADRITRSVCKAIKAQDIEIYTIAFELDDKDTKDLLRDCATRPTYFFDAENAAILAFAFATISDNFSNVSLVF